MTWNHTASFKLLCDLKHLFSLSEPQFPHLKNEHKLEAPRAPACWGRDSSPSLAGLWFLGAGC
jgi:hypothetical protein